MGISVRETLRYIIDVTKMLKLISIILLCSLVNAEKRNPRLFFASVSRSTSTSTSTTTHSTWSYCYTTVVSTVTTACSGRKKRSLVDESSGETVHINPVEISNVELDTTADTQLSYRDARLFLLATSTSTVTATATSTSTSYTKTHSLSVTCLPTSYMAACG